MLYNYCGVCGLKTEDEYTGGYDTSTGYKIYKSICPTKKCGHVGIDHDYQSVKWILGWCRNKKCVKCGKKF